MPTCLDNIVSANFGCDTFVESTSGFDLKDAPEISTINLARIANEDVVTGAQLAKNKLQLAIKEVRNDFYGVLAGNNIMPNLNEEVYETSEFKTGTTYPAEAKERGFTIYRSSHKGNLRKLRIKSISVYPLVNKNGAEVKIYDNGVWAIFTLDLVANQINTIQTDYTISGNWARVVMDGTGMPVGSAHLTCMIGCGGTIPNDCAYTKGWNGTKEISGKEGFGLGVEFQCYCDYDWLLCSLAKTYIGKIIFLKARILLANEWLYTNRLNNWTVYNKEQLPELIKSLEMEYVSEWNTFVRSLPSILKSYKDDCLECRQARWVQNI